MANKSDTETGETQSGPAHTKDYDDHYGAGATRNTKARAENGDYDTPSDRADGRTRAATTDKASAVGKAPRD